MTNRAVVHAAVVTVVLVFAVGIWVTGGTAEAGWLRFYSLAVLAVTLLLSVWDRWLWHVPLAQRLPAVPCDLRGVWRGTLTSFWTDPHTGMRPPPKTVYLVVRQTASRLTATLLTDESRSRSSLGTVTTADGATSLDYMYLNHPAARVEHRSRMHHGSTSLDVTGKPATRLHGRYWTDRDTKGELDFTARRPGTVDDYDEATRLFETG